MKLLLTKLLLTWLVCIAIQFTMHPGILSGYVWAVFVGLYFFDLGRSTRQKVSLSEYLDGVREQYRGLNP